MLTALDADGARVYAREATAGVRHFCPGCHEGLILKRGLIKVAHFAHYAEQSCAIAPETELHREMKLWFYDTLRSLECLTWVRRAELEWPIGERRADVWVDCDGGPVAIECQVSPCDTADLIQKMTDYTAARVATLYVVPNAQCRMDPGNEVRIAEWVRLLHGLNYGRMYVYGDIPGRGPLHPVHLTPVVRWRDGGGGYPGQMVTLRATREPRVGPPIEIGRGFRTEMVTCQSKFARDAQFFMARFCDRKFWNGHAEHVVPFGSSKGARYCDLPEEELLSLRRWCIRTDEPRFGDVIADIDEALDEATQPG